MRQMRVEERAVVLLTSTGVPLLIADKAAQGAGCSGGRTVEGGEGGRIGCQSA